MSKPATAASKPIIINFDLPHRIGSTCAPPCSQCGETEDWLGTLHLDTNEQIPLQPLHILAPAPYADYLEQCHRDAPAIKPVPKGEGYNYFVSVD